ncbi:SdiA-regulated domain-containing protein [Pseudomonas sp. ADAK2]|uniref:SdiA-regulated domain-containing protein n=1 Tax=Pseudomonas TaxID=286 RepID=UPI0014638F69|nr:MULTISPECIES: SdiA-regulated domain-containing protein [unclassified Pseudomonas]QJI43578.1 SdiA-regulated domain-containing protein [Pseudomonas sp. ADAK7]QJI49878.1 SdiA-regulated domain-containing protein [Pseudomonas sp. ADAK2]
MATPPLPTLQTPRRPRFLMRWYYWLLLAVVAGYGLAFAMHWDDRGALWVMERFESPAERQQSIWLPDYRAVIDAKLLPGMEKDEASDLSYDPQTKTLFSVMGKNPFLVELTLQGDVLRKMPLVGWTNPEGVATMGNGLLAITDEREHMLSIVKVDADTRELHRDNFPKYDLGPSKDQNKAFEAIVWDSRNQQLLLGEERPPALFSWKSDGSQTLTGDKQKLASNELDIRNLSALAIDPRTGHTLVLSADSHLLLELDEKGEQVSFMTLLGGFNGLKKTIPRAEGVTMDEAGTLYMVSEPNLFYRFEKQK